MDIQKGEKEMKEIFNKNDIFKCLTIKCKRRTTCKHFIDKETIRNYHVPREGGKNCKKYAKI